MSVGPLGGVFGSAAGAPLSQNQGSESERAAKDATAQKRQADAAQQSEKAAGVGQTEEDQQASERDADGRRLWEAPAQSAEEQSSSADTPRQGKDATGATGNQIDLTG